MASREIDWETAEVRDATLRVELTGNPARRWSERFKAVLAQLDRRSAGWDEVKLTKRGIEVTGVQAGAEADLRHLLESVVLQVNADLHPPKPDGEVETDARAETDARIAETFRSFGERDS